ncbi:MAG TPA: phosphoribosylformylglycinamidine synthase subunit PurL [Vicinamibacterales bacterium]|nr:phosphoribosylformylglycinamidine synthase subunit PurL [Vicinamibacterales bacterium]
MSAVDAAILQRHGLTTDEYDRIVRSLGREPTLTELGIFSVMWSEHCSYKSSRRHLKKLPTEGPRVLQGPGENAGAVDIGDGLAAVFKIESHNHPSFIEPYQGAATGVGGIIRDIFTMGARPIALMNSLRFGEMDGPDGARTRRIVEGVVAGIAGYGNSIGIPTVGGEIAFDDRYAGNPLVNVFCLGISHADALVKGRASGIGNPVYYVGSKTGRDGIHGATMASAEFDEKSAEKRPAVQVGDPFMEKLLLEACLELMKTDALIGVQDMGAAGLTCSTCEMGSRGGAGIEIDVMHVPQRETGMTPYEIMLSESQERMLLVVKKGREAEVERIFEKWDLHAAHIGEVTSDGLMRVKDRGKVVAEIPNSALVDAAPVYDRPTERPAYLDDVQRLDVTALSPVAPADALLALLGSPTIASKRWVFRQYDHMVRTNTIVLAGMGAGVVRVKGTSRALAMSVDGNGRYCYLDPRRGAMLAVAEASRNVACAGAVPIGATNCLNFGNPERPEIMWQLVEAIEGIAEACRVLNVPITGGNVSLYNETNGEAIYPTPILGVVGVLDDASKVLARAFRGEGDEIVLLGEGFGELGGSEYLKILHRLVKGRPPELDLDRERRLLELLARAASAGILRSAHDCSDGGIAVTLAECAFDTGGIGCTVDVPSLETAANIPIDDIRALFGESASRAIVSVRPSEHAALMQFASTAGVPAKLIGTTGGSRLAIGVGGRTMIDVPVATAESVWSSAISRHFKGRAA